MGEAKRPKKESNWDKLPDDIQDKVFDFLTEINALEVAHASKSLKKLAERRILRDQPVPDGATSQKEIKYSSSY